MLGVRRTIDNRGRPAAQLGDVALSPALGAQSPTASQRGVQATEQCLVIGNPVERGGRQDRIDRLVQLHLQQIRSADVRIGAQPLTGGGDHRLGHIHSDHPAVRQPLHQRLGDPARTAAGVEHRLIAGERQPVEHCLAQRLHRPGDPVIALAVPVTHL